MTTKKALNRFLSKGWAGGRIMGGRSRASYDVQFVAVTLLLLLVKFVCELRFVDVV